MLSNADLQRIKTALWNETELNGCTVGYYGNDVCRIVDEGETPSPNFGRMSAIIEENSAFGLDELASGLPKELTDSTAPPVVRNKSRLGPELLGTGLSCGFAVVTGIGVLGSAAAEAPSAGTSTVLLVASWVGFAASAIQCANGVARLTAIALHPADNTLQRWDDNDVYSGLSLVVDAAGIVSSLATLPRSLSSLRTLLENRNMLKSAAEVGQMSRAERTLTMRNAIVMLSKTPEGKAAVVAALRDAGLSDAQIDVALTKGVGSIDKSASVVGTLSKPAVKRLNAELKNVMVTLGSFGASVSPAAITGSASGALNWILVHVFTL